MRTYYFLLALFVFVATNPAMAQELPVRQWNLVWADEFNYVGLPDSKRWNFDTVGNTTGWGNNEAQWYTFRDSSNALVKDGKLHITARREALHGKAFTSARLTTKFKGDWRYGRFEVRARVPKGKGTWPAIWMLPTEWKYGGWPNSGEIDIMEHVGYNPDSVFSTAHTGAYNHIKGTQVGRGLFLPDATDSFHVYRLEWDSLAFRSYVDDQHYFTFPNRGEGPSGWPYDERFHLILNLAIGGGWGGKLGIDTSLFPHTFEVDYVRVYQPKLTDDELWKQIQDRRVADSDVILPPAWAFGLLYGGYTNQAQTLQRIKEIKAHQYPIDAYWIDSWFWDFENRGKGPKKYLDFVADTISFPNRKQLWKRLQQQGVKGGFWVWDAIQQTGNEQAFEAFKQRGFFRNIFTNTDSWHNSSTTTAMFSQGAPKRATPTGNIDFNHPGAVAFFKEQMKPFFDEGADFIKLDRTADLEVCKAVFEMTQQFGRETKGRGFILSHTGGQQDPAFKRYPTKWTDDTRSDWTIESPLVKFDSWVPPVALRENIAMFSDASNRSSEIPFLTNDLGGFDMGKVTRPEEALFIRWLQFSMFNPITEVFSQPENPTSNLAWLYSKQADQVFRTFSHLRMRLFPYIYSYAHRTRVDGQNMIRKAVPHQYQYFFGDALLVAPVHERNAIQRVVAFPEGIWYNWYSNDTLHGGASRVVDAPLTQLPLFVRAGSLIPLRPYAPNVESGSNQDITIQVYPKGSSTFFLFEDDGSSNDYLAGGYAATRLQYQEAPNKAILSISPRQGNYKGAWRTRSWTISWPKTVKPKRVLMAGLPLRLIVGKAGDWQCRLRNVSVDAPQQLEIWY